MKITKEIEEFINLTITEHMGKEYADWKLSQLSVTEPDEVEEEYKKVIATLPQEQGMYAVLMAYQASQGMPLPANVDTGIGRITSENIDEWIETVSAK